jgi:hypothetical protein
MSEPTGQEVLMDEQVISNLIAFLGAFGTPIRMKIGAAIIDSPKTADELADELNTPLLQVVKQLERMVAMGYVYRTHIDGTYAIDEVAVEALINDTYKMPLPAPPIDNREKVIRSFVKEGRLVSIPVQRAKRIVVLETIVDRFELDGDYQEKEVNAILTDFFEDYCALRRALVDHQFLTRSQGIYRRVR